MAKKIFVKYYIWKIRKSFILKDLKDISAFVVANRFHVCPRLYGKSLYINGSRYLGHAVCINTNLNKDKIGEEKKNYENFSSFK